MLLKAFCDCHLSIGGCIGLNTRTSRNVHSNLPPQNPLTEMSNLAPSVVIADCPDNSSLVILCNSGSTRTSLQTSVNKFAVISLTSLCRIEGKPPREPESTCSIVKSAPHSQVERIREGIHPYLKANREGIHPYLKANREGIYPYQRRPCEG